MHGDGFWHWGGMGLGWIVLLVLAVIALGFLFSALKRSQPTTEKSPEEILRERYAKGELGDEEFQRRIEQLGKR